MKKKEAAKKLFNELKSHLKSWTDQSGVNKHFDFVGIKDIVESNIDDICTTGHRYTDQDQWEIDHVKMANNSILVNKKYQDNWKGHNRVYDSIKHIYGNCIELIDENYTMIILYPNEIKLVSYRKIETDGNNINNINTQ